MARDTVILDAAQLNSVRLRRAWSRKQLAAEAGVAPLPATKAIQGEPVALRTAARIAKALDLRVEDLVVLPEAATATG